MTVRLVRVVTGSGPRPASALREAMAATGHPVVDIDVSPDQVRGTADDVVLLDVDELSDDQIATALDVAAWASRCIAVSARGDTARLLDVVNRGAVQAVLVDRPETQRTQVLDAIANVKRRILDSGAELTRLQHLVAEYENDSENLAKVQQALFPESPLRLGTLRFQYRVFASQLISGDFVDYFSLPGGGVFFYVADVSGHGSASAFVTVLLRSFAQRLRDRGAFPAQPDAFLSMLNDAAIREGWRKHVALFAGYIDRAATTLKYASAGHYPPPVLLQLGDVRSLDVKGKPVGLFTPIEFQAKTVELTAPFTLVVCSDGVLDRVAGAGDQQKQMRIRDIAWQARQDIDEFCLQLQLPDDGKLKDDIACLFLHGAPSGGGHVVG